MQFKKSLYESNRIHKVDMKKSNKKDVRHLCKTPNRDLV